MLECAIMENNSRVTPTTTQARQAENLRTLVGIAIASMIIISLTLFVSYELSGISRSGQTQNSIGTQSPLIR